MKLLTKDSPLQLLPTLATTFGLNEAIILQQIHYWLQHSKNSREGYTWVYKTVNEWQREFPFWSTNTIERTLKKLEKQQLIVVDNFNRLKVDRTKWYRINYEMVYQFVNEPCKHDNKEIAKTSTPDLKSLQQLSRNICIMENDNLTTGNYQNVNM